MKKLIALTAMLCLFSTVARADLVDVAQRYLGSNPTGWSHKWCARFLNAVVLPQAGHRGSGSEGAISFARWGSASGPQRGAIAVMRHHVGIVVADNGSTVTLISGNHGHRVGIGKYSKHRIIAYRVPSGGYEPNSAPLGHLWAYGHHHRVYAQITHHRHRHAAGGHYAGGHSHHHYSHHHGHHHLASK